MIAFVQPYGLQAHGGGARILRALLADAPAPFVIVNTSPWRGPTAPMADEIRLPRRPSAGRLESTRLARILAYGDAWMGSQFKRRLAATCVARGVTAIHAIPQGPEFWHAYEVARDLGLRYVLYAHDDLPYNLPSVPYLPWAMDRLGDAWRDADARLVISDAMGQAFGARYGPRPFTVVTDGLASVPTAPRHRPAGSLRVYLMGSIHLSYEGNFDELFRALSLLREADPTRSISLVTRGGFPFRVRNLDVVVESRPWGTQADIERDLDEADLLYLPLPFDQRHASFVRYSLATKLVTYLGSGLPILFHGPADSAAARLLEAHDAGVLATRPDGASLAEEIVQSSPRFEQIVDNALELARSRFLLADQRSGFWGALMNGHGKVPASAGAPRTVPIAR